MAQKASPSITIPFSMLPEGRSWSVGKRYPVKLVLRQTGSGDASASFAVVSASSEAPRAGKRVHLMSDSGVYQGS